METSLNIFQLPNHARVWVYQSNRALSHEEVEAIETSGDQFIQGWASHGKDLSGAIDVIDNHFIVIAVDEQVASASGCSIDSSVGWVKSVQSQLGVDLLNKMNIAFVADDNSIKILPLNDFRDLLDAKQLDGETIVFNNLVPNVGDFKSGWKTSINNSWHKQFLP